LYSRQSINFEGQGQAHATYISNRHCARALTDLVSPFVRDSVYAFDRFSQT